MKHDNKVVHSIGTSAKNIIENTLSYLW